MGNRNTRIRSSQIENILPDDIDAINSIADLYYIRKASGQNKWEWVAGAGGASNLSDLGDVSFDTGTPTDNQVLTYDSGSGKWKAEDATGGASQLSDLSDVGSTTPTDKNVLVADGDSWESRVLIKTDISNLGDGTISPSNIITNGDFEKWEAGDSSVPNDWIKQGTDSTIAKESTITKARDYSAKLTSGNVNYAYLQQSVHTERGIEYWKGKNITFGCWVYATVADRARLGLAGSGAEVYSSYHTGDSTWQWLTVTLTVSQSASVIYTWCRIDSGITSAYFDEAKCVEGSTISAYYLLPNNAVDNFTIINESGTLKIADRIEQNIMLAHFKLAVENSKSIYNLVDGFIDEYEDETGIDGVNSTNEDYDSTNDLYKPSTTGNLELDYMEYSTDELARADWVSSDLGAGGGIDSDTKLMLHLNNNVTDDGETGHTITNNNVTFDGSTKKWGSHSGIFNGSTAYLTAPDHADFDVVGSNSDNWTIDLWVKFDDHAGMEYMISQREAGLDQWYLYHEHGSGFIFRANGSPGAGFIQTGAGGEITDTDWHHVAMIKKGQDYGVYVDGNQVAFDTTSDVDTYVGNLGIGARADGGGDFFDGFMDEIRIQHSNYFNGSPVVGLTDTISIPTEEYGAGAGSLTVYSENTIKNQGSYSLKGIAIAVDSLNETITKTLGTGNYLDLTTYDTIKLDVYVSEVGTNLQIQIHDNGGTTSTKDIVIETGETNSWKTITWDISGIATANKNDIDSIIIKVIDSDTCSNDITFYIDNVYAEGETQNMTLISESQTAEAIPSEARIVVFEEDVDSITINTNLKAYASRDGGSTWAEIILADEGDYESGKRILSGLADFAVTGIGSGTNIEYKITTHNNKNCKIHCVGINWD